MENERGQGDKAIELLKALLEQSSFQNKLLAAILGQLEISVCNLEKISKQTCLSLNEEHIQTGLQHSIKEGINYLTLLQKDLHPSESQHLEQLEKLKQELLKCCPEKEKEKPICIYDPCDTGSQYRPKYRDSEAGTVRPQKTEGAPYPPAPEKDEEEEEMNEVEAPDVLIGKFKGFIIPKSGISPKEMGAADDSPDPVIFNRYTNTTVSSPASLTAADISGADSSNVVLMNGNWYIDYSTDGGTTFKTINPTTLFPETLAGGFCCDQIIQYVPAVDRFIWLLQYKQDTTGANAYRLASASPQDIINSSCTAWTYWDLTSGGYGIGTNWMDYPDLSVGNNFLYISADVVGTGLIVTRIPLTEIQNSSTINFRFTNASSGDLAPSGIAAGSSLRTSYGGHISQNTGDEVYWAGHVDNSTMQIFRWHESSTSYSWRNLDVNNWPQGSLANLNSNGNSNDWLNKLSAFPKFAVIGITRRNNELWMAWTASSGDGGNGGFKFPNPHVQVVKMDINNYHVIEQTQIWNPNNAFAYPCFATNSRNEVGVVLGWGGGGSLHGNTAVGIMGDFVVWYRDGSTWSTNRWGDYVTARRSGTNDQLFAGFGFVTTGSSATTYAFEPFYVVFGRKSVTGDVIG
jgi:hypothetical protein